MSFFLQLLRVCDNLMSSLVNCVSTITATNPSTSQQKKIDFLSAAPLDLSENKENYHENIPIPEIPLLLTE